MKKGQGAFEYVLLLAGILLIVVLAVVLLRSGVFGPGAISAEEAACRSKLATDSNCYIASAWNPCGQVDNTTYTKCGTTTQNYDNGTACPPLGANKKYCGPKP